MLPISIRIRRMLLLALAMALPGSGATLASVPPDTTPAAILADELVVELAAAGVEVYAEPTSNGPILAAAAPVSPVRLLRDQVVGLTAELSAGGGSTVELLDAEIAGFGPDDVVHGSADGDESLVFVSPSELIIGWARQGETQTALLAGRALDDVNPSGDVAVVPGLVLVLFVAEVAAVGASLPDPEPPPEPSGWRRAAIAERPAPPVAATPAAAPAAASRPCSAAVGFVDHVLASVFGAIGRLPTPPPVHTGFGLFDSFVNGIVGIAVGGVNLVIDGAEIVVGELVRVSIGTVMSYVGRVAAVAGSAATIASALRPWTLRLEADPTTVEAPNGGAVNGRIDLGGFDQWPSWAVDCAAVAGVTLPALRPSGSPVTWADSGGGLIVPTERDAVLDGDGAARFAYSVDAEPPRSGVPTVSSSVRVRSTVQRDDTRRLEQEIERLIATELDRLLSIAPGVGGLVSPVVMPLIRPWIAQAFSLVRHLRDVTASVWIEVHYADDAAPPTAPPAAVLDCPSGQALTDALGTGFADPTTIGDIQCFYGYEPMLMIWMHPGVAMPTPGELAAGFFEDDNESDCDPATVGEPIAIAGAPSAIIGCRTVQRDALMVYLAAGDTLVTIAANDDHVAITAAQVMLGTN